MSHMELMNLYHAGKIAEARALIGQLPPEDYLWGLSIESMILFATGDIEDALELATEALEKSKEADDRLAALAGLFVKLYSLLLLGRFNDFQESAKEISDLMQTDHLPQEDQYEAQEMVSLLYEVQASYYGLYAGSYEKGMEMGKKGLALAQEINSTRAQAWNLYILSATCQFKELIDPGVKYAKKAIQLARQSNDQQAIGILFVTLGRLYQIDGDLAKAQRYFNLAYEKGKEIGNKIVTRLVAGELGHQYAARGDYDQAIEQYMNGFRLAQARLDSFVKAQRLNDLGIMYRIKGELSKSLNLFEEFLAISRELNNRFFESKAYHALGAVYYDQGSFQEAEEMFQESLAISSALSARSLSVTTTLLSLVRLVLEKPDIGSAKRYLGQLEEIAEIEESQNIQLNYQLAKALVLKANPRLREKLRAQDLFEAIANNPESQHNIITFALLNLCELLVLEYKSTGEVEIMDEITSLSRRLLAISKEKSDHPTTIKALLLQAKLSLVEGDLEIANERLAEAQLIAEKKGLGNLLQQVNQEQAQAKAELDKWHRLIAKNASIEERIDQSALVAYIKDAVHMIDAGLGEVRQLTEESRRYMEQQAVIKKYTLVHKDWLTESSKIQQRECRVAIAQIGVAETNDFLTEFYHEIERGLFSLREDKIGAVSSKVANMAENAAEKGVNILLFPELSIDLNHGQLREELRTLAAKHNMYIIPGSYHDPKTKRNISVVIDSAGIVWEQSKHNPATIHFGEQRFVEGIALEETPRKTIICNTEFGRIAIVICRDFLDMDLRVELKNCEPPVDLVLNPAFTPVTADFRAAHFDARRSIYAYCFFANIAEYGDSLIYTPEKDRIERKIPKKEENLIYKDVDLFKLRSERRKWESEQAKSKQFIQSTR
ncbi:MAG: tetratricopeptide repeat protein [Candidatus Hodarchaeota archaeon]